MKKIILSFVATVLLLITMLGFILHRTVNEDISRRWIGVTEIPGILKIGTVPNIPEWEIKKIMAYDDHFTAPTCTVYFANGIELLLSTGSVGFEGMDENQTLIGNRKYTVFGNKNDKVYQYPEKGVWYSLKTARGAKEEIIEAYLQARNVEPDSK
ncbi:MULTISPECIES: hypothetical protein [Paenibacillus]|uniref:Uncharacterized protein n=1 Tax=Paenibacillus albilobatus TaxID=2716884 RepID=A0A919XI01_9BACL|nr:MULTISPECIES: hypothetical protein [Paenibacillus]GIO31733.1 hypothetical protein J2TS6_28740 [Paenibacillus albilobatus]